MEHWGPARPALRVGSSAGESRLQNSKLADIGPKKSLKKDIGLKKSKSPKKLLTKNLCSLVASFMSDPSFFTFFNFSIKWSNSIGVSCFNGTDILYTCCLVVFEFVFEKYFCI